MIDFFSAFIGAIIGGIFSLVSTYIIVRTERKVSYYQWLRSQKIETYKNLSNILSQINISVTLNEKSQLMVLDSEAFREKSKPLYEYLCNHSGELELFLPKETLGKIVKLKSLLYRIVSSNDSTVFNFEEFNNKKGAAYELVVIISELISTLQNDLAVYSK